MSRIRHLCWCKYYAGQCVSPSIQTSQGAEACTMSVADWHIYCRYSKILRSCTFYVVHPDSKKLEWVTFYVATKDGSILLSCKTTLALHLIQPRSRLDYIPQRASLITSTIDHPQKTRPALITVHSSKQEESAQIWQQEASTQMQEMQVQVTKPVSTPILKKPGMNQLVSSKEQNSN